MSKFFKALEQAELDRARPDADAPLAPAAAGTRLGGPRVRAPEAVRPASPPPPPPAPRDDRPQPAPEGAPSGIDAHLVSLVAPASFEVEQYRALRNVVEEAHRATGRTVFGISSAAPGDGKTTTAINLAAAFTQTGGPRVLLIEADLRRPSIARQLGLPERPAGLADAVLDARLSLDRVVQTSAQWGFALLPGGRSRGNPYDLLQLPRFAELVQEARSRYAYVLLDTPPLVGLPDCRVIAKVVDAWILLVSAHTTPRKLLQEALSACPPELLLGLVFNRDDHPLSAYYAAYGTRGVGRRGDDRTARGPEVTT